MLGQAGSTGFSKTWQRGGLSPLHVFTIPIVASNSCRMLAGTNTLFILKRAQSGLSEREMSLSSPLMSNE